MRRNTRATCVGIRSEYGENSPVFLSRVLAEFPEEAGDSLVTGAWVDRANELHRTGALEAEARPFPLVLGVDPARLGPDRTAICIRQGPVVREFRTWRGVDTMETSDRIRALVRELLDGGSPVERVIVDEIGLGGGVLDRLRETLADVTWREPVGLNGPRPGLAIRSPAAEGFDAGKRAGRPDRFRSLKAQAYWRVRKLLEEGRLALPRNPDLAEELTQSRVWFAADGRTEIESKNALRDRIGRSPDLADALIISLAPTLERAGKKRVWFT